MTAVVKAAVLWVFWNPVQAWLIGITAGIAAAAIGFAVAGFRGAHRDPYPERPSRDDGRYVTSVRAPLAIKGRRK